MSATPLPAPATTQEADSTPLQLPSSVTTPIESVLAFVGSFSASAQNWAGTRSYHATSRARPWLEFIDLSAFALPEPSFASFTERLQLNVPYFMYNYIMLGLLLTVISMITQPISLIAAAFLVWMYFQLFGVANVDEELQIFGFSLGNTEKVGLMVITGTLLFWLTAGGLSIFLSIVTAVLFVALVHGSFRKPSPEAIPTF